MSNEKDQVSRREALKVIAIGTASALPILNKDVLGQHQAHHSSQDSKAGAAAKQDAPPKFFTASEMAIIAVISDLIVPTDERSPGAKEAEVPAFIDLMVSESPEEVKVLWRDGLKTIDAMSQSEFSKSFAGASPDEQTKLLTAISQNERNTTTPEERFFRAIKNLTIDGYYTSEIGIHKELRYKGNAYLKEFKGCTHPEHQA